LTLLIA